MLGAATVWENENSTRAGTGIGGVRLPELGAGLSSLGVSTDSVGTCRASNGRGLAGAGAGSRGGKVAAIVGGGVETADIVSSAFPPGTPCAMALTNATVAASPSTTTCCRRFFALLFCECGEGLVP
jgi:hypothetical protein